jgi:hypothetical protein
MIADLLKPNEVDLILRVPFGRSAKLAKEGKLPHILLPDGSIRFRPEDVQRITGQAPAQEALTDLPGLAVKLRLAPDWLKAELDAGRIPFRESEAGQLFSVGEVLTCLLRRLVAGDAGARAILRRHPDAQEGGFNE